MQLRDLKSEIAKLIESNNEKKACQFLKREISDLSRKYHELVLLLSRYNSCYTDRYAGLKKYKKILQDLRSINNDLLDFVDTLEDSDLETNSKVNYNIIENPILVMTNEEDVDELKSFFTQLNFMNVKVCPYGEQVEIDPYDIIVYDNQDLEICKKEDELIGLKEEQKKLIQERILLMNNVVKYSNKFIIHFGGMFYWVGRNRKRVHAANSQFSLYARTKELVDFINTYRV